MVSSINVKPDLNIWLIKKIGGIDYEIDKQFENQFRYCVAQHQGQKSPLATQRFKYFLRSFPAMAATLMLTLANQAPDSTSAPEYTLSGAAAAQCAYRVACRSNHIAVRLVVCVTVPRWRRA
ncbi:hypothetical protein [Mixta gaviniae]|uniref:Uncharacterized protein n=1 Tax=Mixta gaviniae TaxID=665914 RepID=A0A1X1E078_9GAMM|nr:hypothetical protein [Mixta gaviniae]AUX93579.1 hypothetical protein C2E15_11150 [Mixta gaviniae]ORM82263.1 hypothetical protein HA44_07565 [Mixta gaviniae]